MKSQSQGLPASLALKTLTGLIVGSSLLLLSACNRPNEPKVENAASSTMGNALDDTVITTKVKSAFLADEYVKSLDIKVETFKADVMLSGFAESQMQIDRSVELAKAVIGVKTVSNKLSLRSGPATMGENLDDTVVTAAVKSAFLADSIMKSTDITVITVKTDVQLSGFVDSDTQINRATEIAKKVRGVGSVVNHLSVKK